MPITTNTPNNFQAPDLEHNRWPAHWIWPDSPFWPQLQERAQSESQSQPTTEKTSE